MKTFLLACAGALSLFFGQPLRASLIDTGSDVAGIPLGVSATATVGNNSSYTISVTVNTVVHSVTQTPVNGNASYPLQNFTVLPEKDTTVYVSASNLTGGTLNFAVPTGYTVYIYRQPLNSAALPACPTMTALMYRVFVHRDGFGGDAGVASNILSSPANAIQQGAASIYLAIGIGPRSNGQPAGAFVVRGPSRQYLGVPGAPFPEIVYGAGDTFGATQVLAPQVFVNITDQVKDPTATAGFTMDFYPRSAAGPPNADGSFPINPGATPFVSYEIAFKNPQGAGSQYVVTRTAGSSVLATKLSGDVTNSFFSLTAPINTSLRTVNQGTSSNGSLRTESTTVYDANSNLSSKVERVYQIFPWGESLIQEVDDPDNKAYTTNYTYDSTSDPSAASYSRLTSVVYPSGNWTMYDYYPNGDYRAGQIFHEYHPWLNAPAAGSAPNVSAGRVITLDYDPSPTGGQPLLKSRTEAINGVTVAQRQIVNVFSTNSDGTNTWTRTVTDGTSASGTLVSFSKVYADFQNNYNNETYAGMPISSKGADGTMVSYAQIFGTYSAPATLTPSPAGAPGPDVEEIMVTGVKSPVTGSSPCNSLGGVAIDPINLIANQSSETIVYRQSGLPVREEHYVYTSSGFSLLSSKTYSYTASGKLTSTTSSDGTSSQITYVNELKDTETDATGVQTKFGYDALLRTATVKRTAGPGFNAPAGASPPGQIVTTFTYDGNDNVTQASTTGSASTLTRSAHFDLSGNLIDQTDENGLKTTYSLSQGGLTQTVTLPGGATQISSYYLDGQLSSVTGTAQVARYLTPSVDSLSSGFINLSTHLGSAASGSWIIEQRNWIGQKTQEQHPDVNGNAVTTTFAYNGLGQLISSSTPGIAPTLYSYTSMGALEQTAVHLDAGSAINLGGTDRISQVDSAFVQDANLVWWYATTKKIYSTNQSSAPTVVGTTQVRVSNLGGSVQAETQSIDADGNVTDQVTAINASQAQVTTTTTAPGATQRGSTVSYNGYLMSATSIAGVTTTYGYDDVGRLVKVTDPRKGAIDTVFYPGSTQIQKVSFDGGSVIDQYGYDTTGRVATHTDAAGHLHAFTYDAMGHPLTVQVDSVQTLLNDYGSDAFGRLQNQTTSYGNPGSSAKTAFTYYGDLPLLHQRTDPSGASVAYSYDSLDRVSTKTDGRGATTKFTYDPGTGELTDRTYSGITQTTPAVHFKYKRSGLLDTVTDAAGQRSFVYNPDLQLSQEQLPNYFGTNRAVTDVYSTTGMLGRLSGLQLGNTTNTAADAETDYNYALADGRVSSIAVSGYAITGRTFQYGYQANAELLVKSVSETASGYSANFTYDTYRDYVSDLTTKLGATVKTDYGYQFNSAGQRSQETKSGDAFADYGPKAQTCSYTYDSQGQLASAVWTLDGVNMAGRIYGYVYDASGNRTSANHTGVNSLAEVYTPNALNQISVKENTSVSVQGTVSTGSKVVVQSTNAGQTDNYWGSEATLSNNTSAAFATIPIYAGLHGAGGDVATALSKQAFIGPFNETPSYDAAGNLTSDSRWKYTWDGENQLVQIETSNGAIAVGLPDTLVKFTYDYLGRRIDKIVTVNGVQQSETKYVYSGWNVAAELNSSGSVLRTFFWGLDATGTVSGAGGVRGLLLIADGGHAYLPTYDGNGNVGALLDAGSGAYVARYEYSPFGELLRESGSYAAANPFRWSTKWTDEETALVYYGHRYYSAATGRFLNQDPLGDAGGLNPYAFCGNDGINSTDYLGLAPSGRPPDSFFSALAGLGNLTSGSGNSGFITYDMPAGPGQWLFVVDGQWAAVSNGVNGPMNASQILGIIQPRADGDKTGLLSGWAQARYGYKPLPSYTVSAEGPVTPQGDHWSATYYSDSNEWGLINAGKPKVLDWPDSSAGPGIARTGASIVVGFIPVVGEIHAWSELLSGRDYITGQETSRWLAAAGIVLGVVDLEGIAELGKLRKIAPAAETATPQMTRLWRAVEDPELADVLKNGDYGIHPNSTFKRFAFDEGSLDEFIKANPTRNYTKTFVDVPTENLKLMIEHGDPGGVGRAIGIDVYENPEFYDWFSSVGVKH